MKNPPNNCNEDSAEDMTNTRSADRSAVRALSSAAGQAVVVGDTTPSFFLSDDDATVSTPAVLVDVVPSTVSPAQESLMNTNNADDRPLIVDDHCWSDMASSTSNCLTSPDTTVW